ncbi:tripartite tricarboxylate transporter permease [Propionimicrobium sp. PCR01-08-3]|uniref:tripartite tricarboxylate transporter permease n=1 Tax=Propionimicrobium sp. PCR01-08-3 TaxID=3052086 RepID=UPI00255CDD32|nr:tripartite tricarboxylate transporter permease [Propionimicrobium sp. PCR01-08-3]WIY81884.1 tripartite tricarboxylate transporter permease [Propionimicrobium sp. PCR01-08-3]
MDIIDFLMQGFSIALTPTNLLMAMIGCLLGTIVGALPGVQPSGAIALLLPLGATLEPTSAIIMLAATYYGGMYGGTLTSVLVNIPGEPSSVATTFDGYKMALKGQAGKALGIAAIGSWIAGTVSVFGLMLFAPPLADIAVSFGPPEYLALALVGLTMMTTIGRSSPIKAALMCVLGLLLSTIGTDPIVGTSRFSFGNINLLGGLDFLPIMIGLFGLAEIFDILAHRTRVDPLKTPLRGLLPNREDWRNASWSVGRGGLLGFFVSLAPGAGPTVSSLLAYGVEKRVAKRRNLLGTGIVEGVAAPESANNAAATGVMVPMLTLGIPGSASTAVLLGGLMMWGIQPGPLLIPEHPDIFWGLVASMLIGNLMLLIINLPLVPVFAKALQVKPTTLVPIVMAVALAGTYSLNNNLFDVLVAVVAGAIGYVLMQHKFPAAPLVLGLVLGPLVEKSLRQSIQMGGGQHRHPLHQAGCCCVLADRCGAAGVRTYHAAGQ